MSRAYVNAPRRPCDECGGAFAPRSRTQRWCDGCSWASVICEGCCQPFEVRRGDLSRRPCRFCSKACKAVASGGVYVAQGRRRAVCRDGSTMLFARVVVANRLGRFLGSDEYVHHRDGDSLNDDDGNLQVVTPLEHARIHAPDMRAAHARRRAA